MLCGYRIFSNDAIAIQQHMLIAISMECSDGCPLLYEPKHLSMMLLLFKFYLSFNKLKWQISPLLLGVLGRILVNIFYFQRV